MTLLLTECSPAGVVMAADSAITLWHNGKLKEQDKTQWRKVLRAGKARALVGYWGYIGRVTSERFDEWLERFIVNCPASDPQDLATALAGHLNAAVGGKPLRDDQGVGLHVAGIHPWDDGVRRATIFHVHNGPGHFEIEHDLKAHATGANLVEVIPRWIGGPRTLFEVHRDLPSSIRTHQENLDLLNAGYTTRNGDFFYYSVVWEALQQAFAYLNLIKGFSLPKNPSSLANRKGLLIAAVDTTIKIYKCSNKPRTIAGTITADAVGPNGFLT